MNKSLLLFAIAAVIAGCSSSAPENSTGTTETTGASATTGSSETTGTTETTGAAAAGDATFASVQPIFSQKCGMCHGTGGKGGINLMSQETILKGGEDGAIVMPGDPDNSVIIWALEGSHGKKQMPLRSAPLSAEDLEKIKAWIKAGAKA